MDTRLDSETLLNTFEDYADEQLYDKELFYIYTTGLKENGALGMAASLKTNRIGFEKIHDVNSG